MINFCALWYCLGVQCVAKTATGIPCRIPGEESRGGLCHTHDPNGKYQLQHPKFAAAVAKIQAAAPVKPR